MRDMRADMEKELRREFKELKNSIEFFSTQFDAMAKRSAKIEKENAALKKENLHLDAECKKLNEVVISLEIRTTSLEQYSRNRNIEIKGVPAIDDENLPNMLRMLGDAVGEPISETDVDVSHRVPRRDQGCPNVVVQFHSRAKRDAVIEKARKKRVCASDFGFSEPSPVFVNEHLCPTLKKLLGQVVARKKQQNWKYAWTKDGKIFARKTDTSRTLRVTCEQDLDKIQ